MANIDFKEDDKAIGDNEKIDFESIRETKWYKELDEQFKFEDRVGFVIMYVSNFIVMYMYKDIWVDNTGFERFAYSLVGTLMFPVIGFIIWMLLALFGIIPLLSVLIKKLMKKLFEMQFQENR